MKVQYVQNLHLLPQTKKTTRQNIIEATISKMETVQPEGNRQVTRTWDFYNLDAIIAVGYRVNSK
jgi:hypothetical protein